LKFKALVILSIFFLGIGKTALAIEVPEYELLFSEDKIEYRLYSSYLVAETRVDNAKSRNDAANEGFMRLFDYITGANAQQAKIAMTAPVQQSLPNTNLTLTSATKAETENGWLVAFMLPHAYSMTDAPIPANSQIALRQIPERVMAVIRYSGRWTEKNIAKYTEQLEAHINSLGIEVLGSPETAFYDPPFMPPFMRHNEVMIPVASSPTTSRQ